MRGKIVALMLFLAAIGLTTNIAGCDKKSPPPAPPPSKRQSPPKPLNQLVTPEEKPKSAQNYPEEAYVEIFAQYDFLFDKNEGDKDAINIDLIKVMKTFGYNPKSCDDVDKVMHNLVRDLDTAINSDPEKGPPYFSRLNELIDNRIEQLWLQDSQKPE